MSTKTSFKRVALVAVAALGMGVLTSVSPASAAVTGIHVSNKSAGSYVNANAGCTLNTAGTTVTMGTASCLTAADIGKSIYTVDLGFIGTIQSITSTTVFELAAAPTAPLVAANTGAAAKVRIGSLASATVGNGIATDQISGMTVTAGSTSAILAVYKSAPATTTKTRFSINGVGVMGTSIAATATTDRNSLIPFTAPIVPGTYAGTIESSTLGTFAEAVPADDQTSITFTLTVVADSAFSSGLTTVYLNDDATKTAQADFTAATDALGASGASTLDADAARIFVSTRKANGTVYAAGTLYAYMTGPGMLDIDGTTDVRSESISNDGTHYINVSGDGTSGVGTVNMYIILADGVTKVDLPSKKVSFYGTVAKLTATVVQGISTASTTTGDCGGLTDCTFATLSEKPSVVIVATDANDVKIPGLIITGTSSDATIVAATSVSGATGATDYNGLGSYNASLTGGVVVGKTATITYSTVVSSLLTISSAPVTIANAGTPATVTWALDKTSYAPGAPVVITVTAKDAAGNAAGDNTYATLFAGATVLGGAVTGSTPAASVELVGGKATYTAFAPGTSGSYVISNKLGASVPAALQGTSLTGTIAVTGGTLETLVNSLIKKINALSTLVAKIQKKLGVK